VRRFSTPAADIQRHQRLVLRRCARTQTGSGWGAGARSCRGSRCFTTPEAGVRGEQP